MNKYLIISVCLILALILLIFAGCSGGDSSNRFYDLLKLIPSVGKYEGYPMILIDYASYREDNNISFSASSNITEVLTDYLNIVTTDEVGMRLWGSYITGYGRWALEGIISDKYVGYDFTCVDAEIQAGTPPADVVAAIGRFNPQATRDALNYQDEWPSWVKDAYTIEEYRGITLHSWGDGIEIHMTTRLVPPHVDNLGRARPLAITENRLFYAPGLSIMKLMIDASQDKTESLADLPEFASIAKKLSEMNTYAAVIGDEEYATGDPMFEGTYPGPKLKRFVTFGSGLGEDEKGTYIVLVIYHENSNDAEANISLLEQRISDTDSVITGRPWRETFPDIDVRTEGNILVAKLYTERAGIWSDWVYSRDPLLLH